jgi:hypothetical protein
LRLALASYALILGPLQLDHLTISTYRQYYDYTHKPFNGLFLTYHLPLF